MGKVRGEDHRMRFRGSVRKGGPRHGEGKGWGRREGSRGKRGSKWER